MARTDPAFAVLLSLAISADLGPAAGKQLAIVIGNDAYAEVALLNAG
jgi:hypothetical protein